MSRIGNKSIQIPDKVKVSVANGGELAVEGPKGKLAYTLPSLIQAKVDGKEVSFARSNEERETKALHGLARSLVNNMVLGRGDRLRQRPGNPGRRFQSCRAG